MLERGCQMPDDLNLSPDIETRELFEGILNLEWWFNEPGVSTVEHCEKYLKILN